MTEIYNALHALVGGPEAPLRAHSKHPRQNRDSQVNAEKKEQQGAGGTMDGIPQGQNHPYPKGYLYDGTDLDRFAYYKREKSVVRYDQRRQKDEDHTHLYNAK